MTLHSPDIGDQATVGAGQGTLLPWRYGIALLAVAAALLLMFALYQLLGIERGRVPFIFFFVAVVISARYGGLGPGIASVGLSAFVADYFFLPPFNSFRLDLEGALQVAVFVTVASVIVQLTEKSRRAEHSSRASAESLSITLQSIGDAVIATDVEGSITFMNPVAASLTGWTAEAARGRKLDDVLRLIDKETRAPIDNSFEQVIRKKAVVAFEDHALLISKDGSEWPIEDSGAPIKDRKGKILGVVIVFHDITERLSREARLRESEERLGIIASTASDAIFMIDATGTILFVNPACERIFGYTSHELLGRRLTTLIPEYLRAAHETALARYLESGQRGFSCEGVEFPGLHHDGHEIPVEVSFAEFVQDGKVCFTGIVRDITARKEAERAIKESEGRYRGLVEKARDIIYSHDLNGNFTSVNAACQRILGYSPEALLGMRTVDVLAPEHVEISREMLRRKLAGDSAATIYEVEFIASDGRRVPVEVNSYLIYANGKPTGVQGVWRDITERKRVEASIRETDERYRLLFESNPHPMWVYDRETFAFLAVNDAAIRHYGYTREEFLSLTIKDIRPKEDVPRLVEDVSRVVAGLGAVTRWRHLKKDGTVIDVEIASHALVFAGRQAELVLANDITERKQAEEALRASETRYRALADAMPQIVWTARPDGYVDYYNKRWFDYTGMTMEQTEGWGWQPAVHPEDTERCLRRWSTAVANGEPCEIEYRFRRASDGAYRWHLSRSEPARDSNGQIIKWFGSATDIHDQKLAEERLSFLAEANQLLASSLDYETTLARLARLCVASLADFCLIDLVGDDGAIHRVASTHIDPTKADLVDELRRFPPDLSKSEGVPEVLRTGQPLIVPTLTEEKLDSFARCVEHREILRQLGPRSFMAVPLITRGRPAGAITFTLTDVERFYTQRDLGFAEELARRAAVAIDNALLYSRAQDANRAKDEFLATLSHELRTPLTPILGWVQMIRGGHVGDEAVAQGLDVIGRNSESLLRLISDLLDMTSILSGKMRIQRAPVELAEVIHEAAETIRLHAERLRVSLEIASDGHRASTLVSGDRTRLVQVFWNVLSNAVKFSRPGGCIRVSIACDDGAVRVDVTDEGEGIEQEFLPRVFDRFTQADSSTTRLHGGLGIGLALVKSFVEAHGGSVSASSGGKGWGSRFTVSLPLAQNLIQSRERTPVMEEPKLLSTTPSPGRLPVTASSDQHLVGSRRRVLVVDDARDTLELLKLVFGMRGYDVVACETAEEALTVAPTARFDIIVSDIGLPRIDGYELIGRLREIPHLRTTPALALTGYAARKDAEAALAAGFDGHVAKPVEPSALAAETERLLERKSAGASEP
jgi:PAS domain S-box-containing protein